MLMAMDKNLLALFWTLAEGQEQQRIDAVTKLIKILSSKQKNKVDHSDELTYTIKRLVRGLSSDRKFARHGFATALTQVLRHFDCVTVTSLLKTIKEELKITKGDPKSEQSNVMVGRVMAFLTIIQSNRILLADDSEVSTVIQSLNKIRKQKVLLHQICTNGVTQLISKVSEQTMKSIVWPVLEEELSAGWAVCEPDTLIILMTVIQYHQAIVDKKLLSEHWGSKKLISEKNFEKIGAIMAKSTSEHPVIHPVCNTVLEQAAKKPEMLVSFCQKVINECLLHQAIPKKYLSFQLIKSALKHVSTVEQVKAILSENLVGLLMKQLQDKEQPLYTVSRELVQTFVSSSQKIIDPEVQLTFVLRLLQPPGSVFFDNVTKSSTVTGIVRNLNCGAAEMFSELLMDMILGGNKIGHKATIESEVVIRWGIPVLANMITLVSKAADGDWQLKVLQFLFLHGFFEIKQKDKTIPHCSKPVKKKLSQKLMHMMQENFFRALNKLATFSPGRGSKYHKHSVAVMQKLMSYVNDLLASEHLSPHKTLAETSLTHWRKVHGILKKIGTEISKDKKMGEKQAFEMLFLHLGLQIFHEPKAAAEALQDLYVCYERAFKKKSAKTKTHNDTDDEPEWIEVVTDILLSLLSQNSHLLRTVVKTVFTILCPHITSASLQLILDVLKSSGAEEESIVDFDDDEEAMDEGFNDAETGSNISEKTEESEITSDNEITGASDSDSDSADEPEDIDDNLKDSLKAALGKAAPSSDQEMSEEDLSDGEMEKLDDVLAAAFKSMRRGKKENKEKRLQLKHYKMRCLDLIEVLVQGETPTGFLLELLDPLLNLMEDTQKEKDMKELFNRATNVYHGLVKPKKVVNNDSVDGNVLPEVVQDLITKSTTVTGVPMICEVSNAVIFVTKIVQDIDTSVEVATTENDGSPQKNQKSQNLSKVYSILRKAVEDYCKRRDSLLNHMLFTVMLDKQPVLMWPLMSDFLELAQDESVRVFCRTHVCSMVAALVNKNTISVVEKDTWADYSKKIIMQYLEIFNGIMEQSPNNRKHKFVHEVLLVLNKVFQLTSDELVQELVPEIVLKKLEKAKEESNKNKDIKSQCNKLSSILSKRLKSGTLNQPKQRQKRILEVNTECGVSEPKRTKKEMGENVDLHLTDAAVSNLKLVADHAESKAKINKKKRKKLEETLRIAKMNSIKAKKLKNNKLKKKKKSKKAMTNGDTSVQPGTKSEDSSGNAVRKNKKKDKKNKKKVTATSIE